MGHNQDANIIAKSKGHRETIAQLNTWRIDFFREITTPGVSALFLVARRLLEPFQIILQWIFLGALAGFGYGTIRIVVLFFAVWLVCGFLYRESARQEGFAPSNPVIYTDAKNAACSEKWVHCLTKPKELNDFNPFAYSADIMIPPLDLGQKKDWDPINKNVKFRLFGLELGSLGEDGTEYIKRAQTIIGWLFLGLLGASLSGIIRRD